MAPVLSSPGGGQPVVVGINSRVTGENSSTITAMGMGDLERSLNTSIAVP